MVLGYHTSTSSLRNAVPAKLPLGGVGRGSSTRCRVERGLRNQPAAAAQPIDRPTRPRSGWRPPRQAWRRPRPARGGRQGGAARPVIGDAGEFFKSGGTRACNSTATSLFFLDQFLFQVWCQVAILKR